MTPRARSTSSGGPADGSDALSSLSPTTVRPGVLLRLGKIASDRSGVELPESKAAMIAARLLPRLRQLQLTSFDDYLASIDEAEAEVLVDRLTTHETSFFRDREQFDMLVQLIRERFGGSSRIAALSAACSTGEEAWTVGMLLLNCLNGAASKSLSVLGTDISTRALGVARGATYPIERSTELPPSYLKQFMLRGTGEHAGTMRVVAPLRQITTFVQENILSPRLGTRSFEVILLRNVLMYFCPERRRAAITTMRERLAPNGLLVVSRVDWVDGLGLNSLGHGIFEKTYLRTAERAR